jgi:hypothetical protein
MWPITVPFGIPLHGVERISGHAQIEPVHLPFAARTIGVDLDAESIGIREIQRLAHEMVGHAEVDARLMQVQHRAAERRAVGQQDGEVEEPEP